MELSFAKLSPTKNMTLIVTTPVPVAEQAAVAERLMGEDYVGAEQVGFIVPKTLDGADGALRMMGGEFCGNATMSLGALLAIGDGLENGASREYRLQISGAAGLVKCRIERLGACECYGTVDMPLPIAVETVDVDGLSCPLVRFDGIAHALLPADSVTEGAARKLLPLWCERFGTDACGAIFLSEGGARIDPLVYVRGTNSFTREHGCGSGTSAVGAYMALESGSSVELELTQPGGVMRVTASMEGEKLATLTIGGKVTLIAEGRAWV